MNAPPRLRNILFEIWAALPVCSRRHKPRVSYSGSHCMSCDESLSLRMRRCIVVLPDGAPHCQVWFKHDLRTDDHPGLLSAAAAAAPLVPCFCFDERLYGQLLRTPLGFEGEHINVPALMTLRIHTSDRDSAWLPQL